VTELLRFFLRKADRILKRPEFKAFSETGRRLSTHFFIVLVAPAKSGRSRIGITVSRKVGGAVERNRIKRLAREAFRLNRHLLDRPWDLIFIARRAAAEQPNWVIAKALKEIYDNLTRKLEN